MSGTLRVAWAFLVRDFHQFRPTAWLTQMTGVGMAVLFWHYISRMVPVEQLLPSGESHLDYFTFALIGIALTQYVWRGFIAFSGKVRAQRDSGALEILWNCPHPFWLLVLCTSLWDFLLATLNAVLILLLGTYGFGANLSLPQIVTILAIGGIGALSMGSLGLLFASWSMAFGGGEGVRALMGRVIPFLSGAFFPVSLFPGWVRALAVCVPLTHALNLSRGVVSSPAMPARSWQVLLGVTLGVSAAALASLHVALWKARVNGRLSRGPV